MAGQGFMSGFGEAFSSSFKQSRQNSFEKKQEEKRQQVQDERIRAERDYSERVRKEQREQQVADTRESREYERSTLDEQRRYQARRDQELRQQALLDRNDEWTRADRLAAEQRNFQLGLSSVERVTRQQERQQDREWNRQDVREGRDYADRRYGIERTDRNTDTIAAEQRGIARDKTRSDQDLKNDMFLRNFQANIDRRVKYDDLKIADAQIATQASNLLKANNAPPELKGQVISMLKGNTSVDKINEYLTNNTFEILDTTPKSSTAAASPVATAPKGPPTKMPFDNLLGASVFDKANKAEAAKTAQANSTDPRLAENGMEDFSKPITQEYLTNAPGVTTDVDQNVKVIARPRVTDKELGGVNSTTEAAVVVQRAIQSGDPVTIKQAQDIQSAVQAAETQKEVIRARADAEAKGLTYTVRQAFVTNPQTGEREIAPVRQEDRDGIKVYVNTATGQQISGNVEPFNDTIEKEYTAAVNKIQGVKEYGERVLGFDEMVGVQDEILGLAQNNEAAITRAGGLASTIAGIGRDIKGFQTVFGSPAEKIIEESTADGGNKGFTQQGLDAIVSLENSITSQMGGVDDTARARALIEAKAVRLAYSRLMASGQKGNAVARTEFDREFNSILGNGDPKTMLQNFREYTAAQQRGIDNQYQGLVDYNVEVQTFQKKYGAKVANPITPLSEQLSERTTAALGRLSNPQGYLNTPPNQAQAQPQQAQSPVADTMITISSPNDEAFKNLPTGTQFKTPDGQIRRKN